MTDDIVARLRIIWTSMSDMGNHERAEAADEIERLRAQLRTYTGDGHTLGEHLAREAL